MATRLYGSGGDVTAEITEEQRKKADLGVGRLFLAPIGKLDEGAMLAHRCKACDSDFEGPPGIRVEERPNEEVADGLTLAERGQYVCRKCGGVIGEYRVFV